MFDFLIVLMFDRKLHFKIIGLM